MTENMISLALEKYVLIGVSSGYGGYDELSNAGADFIVSSVVALRRLLFSNTHIKTDNGFGIYIHLTSHNILS